MQFNLKQEELQALADSYKELKIKGVDDNIGYTLTDTARKDLRRIRKQIQKIGKEMRNEANKFAKSVIAEEKKLVALIEPTEKFLAEEQIRIDRLRKGTEGEQRQLRIFEAAPLDDGALRMADVTH